MTLIHCSLSAKKAKRQECNIKFYLVTAKSKNVIPLGTQIHTLEEKYTGEDYVLYSVPFHKGS